MRETIEAIIICVWRVRPELLPSYYKSLEQGVGQLRELSKPAAAGLSALGPGLNEDFCSCIDEMVVLSLSLLKDILLRRINPNQALALNPQAAVRGVGTTSRRLTTGLEDLRCRP